MKRNDLAGAEVNRPLTPSSTASPDWPGPLRWMERVNVLAVARVFWCLSTLSLILWSFIPTYDKGWDVEVYRNAIQSIRAGHDPYADAVAVQAAYQHNPLAYQPGVAIPYCYVYSPITLPVMRLVSLAPLKVSGAIYWTVFFLSLIVLMRAVWGFVQPKERNTFSLLASIAIFFPGMIESDCFWSGNIAFILYAAVFAAAWLGWRKGQWGWFYAAVFVSGLCKAPMLSLLAIPVFSARRQWWKAGLVGALGVALFAMQPHVWPGYFRNYLEAVDMQFRYNRDFSSSPAGLIANALFFRAPYKMVSAVSYLAYAVLIVAVLAALARRYLAGRMTIEQYGPVLLLGTILLNPRVMEYDIAPVTIPVALVLWRLLRNRLPAWIAAGGMAAVFALINILASQPHTGLDNPPWKLTAGCFLSLMFVLGCWDLFARMATEREPAALEPQMVAAD